ncbi:MAG: glycosyltransferase family 39 protein [Bryobacteraceae bacterium]
MKRVSLFLLLLLPSAYFAWTYCDMPRFCRWIHDDSIYFVSAKSLADGQGYRILSLPGEPFQTKYPPLLPLVLAGVWKLNPEFPANLKLAALVSWLALPLLLLLCLRLYRDYGFTEKEAWAVVALLAVNPYLLVYSSTILSELPFTCLLILCLLLCRRAAVESAPLWWAVLAGVTGGLSFLTRTTGMLLLASGAAYFLWHRRRKQAMWFVAAMLPFVAAWTLWTRMHSPQSSDTVTLYFTSYFGYFLYLVRPADLPMILWKNVDQWLMSAGALVLPDVREAWLVRIITQTLGAAMIAGVVRMARKGRSLGYAFFAVPFSLMLLVWHVLPDQRLIAPIYPLLLAGFWTEMRHIFGMIMGALGHRRKSQRIAAVAFGLAIVGVLGFGAWTQYEVGWRILPRELEQRRKERAVDEAAFRWMTSRLPPGAQLAAFHDPALYLYTGHRACGLIRPSMHMYRNDTSQAYEAFTRLAGFAREHRLDYAYFADTDFPRHISEADCRSVHWWLEANPELELVHRFPSATLYRFVPRR